MNYLFPQVSKSASILLLVQDDVEHLILTERIESIIPLTYVAIMTMAYYGPNAEIMGSVKLQIWHHENIIEDFESFAMNFALLLAMDFLSFVINGFLMWKFCKINIFRVLCNIQKRYWYIMIFMEAYLLSEVNYTSYLIPSKLWCTLSRQYQL